MVVCSLPPTNVGHHNPLEKGKSVSEHIGPGGGCDVPHWASTLALEGVVMSHIGWGGEQTTIYKGVETFPNENKPPLIRV